MRVPNSKSSGGSAMRTMRMAPVGETDGSGGAASSSPPASAAPVVPVTAPEGKPEGFSQEQVNAIVQQRLAEDRNRRPKAPDSPPAKASKPDLEAQVERLTLRNAFDKRAAKFDLTDSASDRLFRLYETEKPEDPTAWFTETASQFGLKGPNMTAPPSSTTGDPATAVTPPASAPNAPVKVDPMTSGGLVDIFNLSAAQLQQLGPRGLRTHFEKALEVGNQLSGAPPRPQASIRK